MDFLQAIGRLKNRDHYLAERIAEFALAGKSSHWFELDRESIAIAISCIEFTQKMQEYESTQVPR